jgi:hypothetical protein
LAVIEVKAYEVTGGLKMAEITNVLTKRQRLKGAV